MFCPQCGVEYRPGYTSCSDCHVFLVHERLHSLEQESVSQPGDPNRDPFCSFWKGTDARICAELCAVLDEAGIPHKTIHRADHLFNIANQVPYELGVPASLYEKAELAVKEAFGTDEEESERLLRPSEENSRTFRALTELPLNEKWAGRPEEEQPSLIESLTWQNRGDESSEGVGTTTQSEPKTAEWYPEDATAEVWDGNPSELQEMIDMSVHENGIRTRWEDHEGKLGLFVLPEDEARAREIIREILESTPLE